MGGKFASRVQKCERSNVIKRRSVICVRVNVGAEIWGFDGAVFALDEVRADEIKAGGGGAESTGPLPLLAVV